jgi:hypothetical protein
MGFHQAVAHRQPEPQSPGLTGLAKSLEGFEKLAIDGYTFALVLNLRKELPYVFSNSYYKSTLPFAMD